MIPILLWWLIIQLLGWAALPIAYRLLHWLPDRGYTSSKAIGLLLTTYLLWLGATLGLLPNTIGGALLALLLLTLCSTYLLLRPQRPLPPSPLPTAYCPLPTFLRQHKTLILASEALFTLAFIAWAILRAYASEKIMPAGGEKFMEIAFLNAILRSPRFPPLDPWLSGYSISYYYFGYVMMALITRLSAVPSAVAFDLYDALLFALSALGAFGLVYNLIPSRHPEAVVCTAAVGCTAPNSPLPTAHSPLPTPPADAHQIRYGLLAAFFLVVISNLEGVLESLRSLGKISDGLAAWTGVKQLIETPIADVSRRCITDLVRTEIAIKPNDCGVRHTKRDLRDDCASHRNANNAIDVSHADCVRISCDKRCIRRRAERLLHGRRSGQSRRLRSRRPPRLGDRSRATQSEPE